jgi:tRNA pseudouridine38-40 synthase
MHRWKLTVEYDGSGFVGWQRQENGSSIQEKLEKAVGKFCQETVTAHAAGRTDAGVHALGQVVHIDIAKDTDADTVRDALNFHLRPCPISVVSAEAVPDDFHARFSATARHYVYRVLNRRAPVAVGRGLVWHVAVPLDAEVMDAAARTLTGTHDFTTFRASQCQADSPVKSIDYARVRRSAETIELEVGARSFLHHQVRSIMGSLKLVGEGKWSVGDFRDALEAADRTRCGPVAPAHGLYLTKVDYPS